MWIFLVTFEFIWLLALLALLELTFYLMPCQRQPSQKKAWRILQASHPMEIAQETYNLFQFISFCRHLVCGKVDVGAGKGVGVGVKTAHYWCWCCLLSILACRAAHVRQLSLFVSVSVPPTVSCGLCLSRLPFGGRRPRPASGGIIWAVEQLKLPSYQPDDNDCDPPGKGKQAIWCFHLAGTHRPLNSTTRGSPTYNEEFFVLRHARQNPSPAWNTLFKRSCTNTLWHPKAARIENKSDSCKHFLTNWNTNIIIKYNTTQSHKYLILFIQY